MGLKTNIKQQFPTSLIVSTWRKREIIRKQLPTGPFLKSRKSSARFALNVFDFSQSSAEFSFEIQLIQFVCIGDGDEALQLYDLVYTFSPVDAVYREYR